METEHSAPGQLVKVSTQVDFIEEQSDQYQDRYVFSYTLLLSQVLDLVHVHRGWIYTYNDKNLAASKTDKPSMFDSSGGDRVKTFTYICE